MYAHTLRVYASTPMTIVSYTCTCILSGGVVLVAILEGNDLFWVPCRGDTAIGHSRPICT